MAAAKKAASDNLMKEIEEDTTSKKMFKIAKQALADSKDVSGNVCIRDKQGNLCIEEKERAAVWKEYMEKLMNEENEWDNRVEAGVTEGLVEEITLEEVVKATKAMKLGKTAGESEVAVEHILAILK